MILAEDGRKMSKSLKNYPDPEELLNSYGGDSLKGLPYKLPCCKRRAIKIFGGRCQLVTRNIILPLWNSFHFFQHMQMLMIFPLKI
ncbi:MAG: hypothetical protein Ct9H90mP22_2200 [Gammaproteobacteria bacterium]|nr:MAG: hypothetical protein Ct9H90mP22_2200 [Gammaproteobacteria bacterium]